MRQDHRAQIGSRIHLALMRELGQGIDVKQLLHSELYARDVLLVCQAYPGSELQRLAAQFRQAGLDSARDGGDGRHERSGFGVSRPPATGTPSDFDSGIDSTREPPPARRWLALSTWFAR